MQFTQYFVIRVTAVYQTAAIGTRLSLLSLLLLARVIGDDAADGRGISPRPGEHDAGVQERHHVRLEELLLPLQQSRVLVELIQAQYAVAELGGNATRLADRPVELLAHQSLNVLGELVLHLLRSLAANGLIVLLLALLTEPLQRQRLLLLPIRVLRALEKSHPALDYLVLGAHRYVEEELQGGDMFRGSPTSRPSGLLLHDSRLDLDKKAPMQD